MNINSEFNIKSSIDNIYNDNLIKNLNKTNRYKLIKSINVLENAKIPIVNISLRISEIKNALKLQEKNVDNVLNDLSKLKTTDDIIIYKTSTGWKTEILNLDSSFINKAIYKIKKLIFNDYSLLNPVFETAVEISRENIDYQEKISKTLNNLKKLRNDQNFYYASEVSIKKHATIITEINKILDLNPSIEADMQNVRNNIEDAKKFLESMSIAQRFLGFTGMSIAPTVAPTNENSIMNAGGFGIFTTEQERNTFEELLNDENYLMQFSPEEKIILKRYFEDLQRSKDLSYMVQSLLVEEDEDGLRITSKRAFDQIQNLKSGQSLFLDVGYLGHCMRAQFQKNGNKIEINLFDSSGALELWVSKNPFLSIMHYLLGQKQYITLSTSVSVEEFNKSGRAYLEQVIGMQSKKVTEQLKEKSNYFRYMDFIRVFRSINPNGSLLTRQTVQKTNNCYAQRIRAAQAHCLGSKTYKKVRVYSLKKIYQQLMDIARDDLGKKKAEQLEGKLTFEQPLKPDELQMVRDKLNTMEEFPTNVEDWYQIFALIKHNIYKQRK